MSVMWDVVALPYADKRVLDEYLRAAWEPFAVTVQERVSWVWLRKKARG